MNGSKSTSHVNYIAVGVRATNRDTNLAMKMQPSLSAGLAFFASLVISKQCHYLQM